MLVYRRVAGFHSIERVAMEHRGITTDLQQLGAMAEMAMAVAIGKHRILLVKISPILVGTFWKALKREAHEIWQCVKTNSTPFLFTSKFSWDKNGCSSPYINGMIS